MWSKRPEARKQQHMTSFKSKITRRKRKLSNSGLNNVQFLAARVFGSNSSLFENVVVSPNSVMVNKGKSDPPTFYVDPGKECGNWSNGCDAVQNVDQADNCCADDIIFMPQIRTKTETAPVSLVHSNTMRYSDSFVLSNNKNNRSCDSEKVRKSSVYIQEGGNTVERSDSVKYKPSNSSLYRTRQSQKQANDPAKMQLQQRQLPDSQDNQQKAKNPDGGGENKRQGKNKKKNGKSKQSDAVCNDSSAKTSSKPNVTKTEPPLDDKKQKKTSTKDPSVPHESYLKRVKSKIYKHSRSDSNVSQNSSEGASDSEKMKINKKDKKPAKNSSKIPKIKNNAIPEESEVKLKKSTSTLFLRQYSNLERVRPKSFGVKSSNGFFGITDLVDHTTNILNVPVEQPKLTKSKSSSAINLNLLRSRRNKILEQSKNCKNAETEFSFITYPNTPKKETTVVDGPRDRPSSWIIGSISEVEG